MSSKFAKEDGEGKTKNRVIRGDFAVSKRIAKRIIDKGHKPGRLAGIDECMFEPPQAPGILIGISYAANLVKKIKNDGS